MGKIVLHFVLYFVFCGLFVSCESKRETVWIVSTPEISWQAQAVYNVKWEKGDAETVIDLNNSLQTIEEIGRASCRERV